MVSVAAPVKAGVEAAGGGSVAKNTEDNDVGASYAFSSDEV